MEGPGAYPYEKVDEVDHTPDLPIGQHDIGDACKTSVVIPTAPYNDTKIDSIDNNSHESSANATRLMHQWWTRSWKAPSAFIVTFLAMLVALEIIYRFSEKDLGLATSIMNRHYLWTYGPTAVLIVIAALWRQLDYRTKQSMPWAEMAKGPALPEKSILLDYISPTLPTAMYRSLKNRHFVVLTTIAVFVVLKMIMIVSTGLLVLERVLIDKMPTELLVTDVFDANNFVDRSVGRSRAALAVQGVQKYNLSFPLGTTSEYAFQSFQATADSLASSSAILNGTVEYFMADLDCEIGDVNYTIAFRPFDSKFPYYYNTSVTTKTCRVDNAYMDTPIFGPTTNVSADYYALVQPANCSNADPGRDDAHRLMVSIGYPRSSNVTQTGTDKTMVNVTGILCTPRYGIGRANVLQNLTRTDQRVADIFPIEENTRELAGLSPWTVAKGVLSAMNNAPPKVNGTRFFFPPDPVGLRMDRTVFFDGFFELFLSARPNIPLYTYMDPLELIAASNRTFKSLAAQVAHQNLMSPGEHTIQGSFSDYVDRIMVQKLPLRLMQGLLSAAIVMTIIVGLMIPRFALPRPANCIGFYISVFARSLPVLKPLEGSVVCTMDRIRQVLSIYRFQMDVAETSGCSQVHIISTTAPEMDPIHMTSECADWHLDSKRWWRPFGFSLPAMLFTLLTPPTFIVLLEILLRYGRRHQGLVDIDAHSPYRYAWLFGLTLLLVLVATLFNILDFDIETTHPFQRLRWSAATASSSILNNPLSKLTPMVLWDAVRFRDIALGVAACSVMLAPFLPIVVSGLYTVQNIYQPQAVRVQQTDWFQNLSRPLQSNRTFSVLPGLIAQQNLTYPQWTYDEIVLPKVSLDPLSPSVNIENPGRAVSVAMQVPALRGAMNCSVIPVSDVKKIEMAFPKDFNQTVLRFDVYHDTYCTIDGMTTEDGQFDGQIPLTTTWRDGSGYIGDYFILDNSCGGAQLLLAFGYVDHNQTKDLRILTCAPYTEELKVDLILTLPSYSVSPTQPPVAIESSARYLSNDTFMPGNIPSLEGYQPTTIEGFFSESDVW